MGADKKLLLEVSDLKVHFSIKSGKAWPWAKPSDLKAVDGVTLRLYEGETLGVVGESRSTSVSRVARRGPGPNRPISRRSMG
ncbi:hypothetical protein A6767_12250 [Aeromonas veronii]|nr:hypothetical protein A6767_12250 [Aeromonas veronii]